MIRTSPIAWTGTLKPARPRNRKCAVKGCSGRVTAPESFVRWCSPACGTAIALNKLAKQKTAQQRTAAAAERAQHREAKARLKTRTEHLADAQAVFNRYIRARDAALPCISCGRHHQGSWDAGHYRSVGAQPALRFHEDNTHRQCVPCNQHKGGNAIEYRLGLLARIGAERVEFLEREHPPAKYSIEDAKRIKAEYTAKLKQMKEAA